MTRLTNIIFLLTSTKCGAHILSILHCGLIETTSTVQIISALFLIFVSRIVSERNC